MIPLEHFRTIDYVHVREGRLVYLQKIRGANSYKNSFFPSTIRLWNSLPSDITRMQSLEAFKGGIASSLISLDIYDWLKINLLEV
jgi:hypothetical protein